MWLADTRQHRTTAQRILLRVGHFDQLHLRNGANQIARWLIPAAGAADVARIMERDLRRAVGYEIRLKGERAADHPKVFTTIFVEHVVRGRGLSPESVRHAVELSANRYCSAAAMLGKVARIEESYRIIDDATGQEHTAALPLAV